MDVSNFAEIESGIEISGIVYPSVEHAYQAHKFIPSDRHRFSVNGEFLSGKTRGTNASMKYMGLYAKRASMKYKSLKLTPIDKKSFQEHNIKLMYSLLSIKFRKEQFKSMLLSTKDEYLLEIPAFEGRLHTSDMEWQDCQQRTLWTQRSGKSIDACSIRDQKRIEIIIIATTTG